LSKTLREPPPTPWQLPDPRLAEPGADLIALGADLEPGTVLAGYRAGLFPMDIETDDGSTALGWWSPDPRGIIPLDNLRVSRSLRKSCRRFTVTVDQDFRRVMLGCADESRASGWITPAFIDTYTTLHELGWAHSIEVWDDAGQLAGGLYGVQVGGLFAGESMFHRKRDASKVALVALVEWLQTQPGPHLLDVQWATDHLRSLGAIEIPRDEYLDRLAVAINHNAN
jgi:leucyl/phenylalanyl-tRNA--protein transferase